MHFLEPKSAGGARRHRQNLLLKTLLILLCIYIKRISAAPAKQSPICAPTNEKNRTPLGATHDVDIVFDDKIDEPDTYVVELICPLDELITKNCQYDYNKAKLTPCPYNKTINCTLAEFKQRIMESTRVLWLKNKQPLHRENGNPIAYSEPNQLVKKLSLFNVGLSDEGNYICKANYTLIHPRAYDYFKFAQSASFKLELNRYGGRNYIPDVAPVINYPPVNQTHKKGSNVTFDCKGIVVLLSPTTYWFKCLNNNKSCTTTFEKEFKKAVETKEAENLLKYAIDGVDGNKLEIKNISEETAGFYGCWQVNKKGVDIRIAKLEVIDEATTYPPSFTVGLGIDFTTTTTTTSSSNAPINYTRTELDNRSRYDNVNPQPTTITRDDTFNTKNVIIIILISLLTSSILLITILLSFKYLCDRCKRETKDPDKLLPVCTVGRNMKEANIKQHLPDNDSLDIYNIGKVCSNLKTDYISGRLTHSSGQFMTQSICNQVLDEEERRRNLTMRSNNSDEASSWGKKSIITYSTNAMDFSKAPYLLTSETTATTVPVYDHPPPFSLTGRRIHHNKMLEATVQDACVINPTYGFIRSENNNSKIDGSNWYFPRRNLDKQEKIGEGQFGEVWRCLARQPDGSGTFVAVKQLKYRVGLGARERLELLAEIEIMKSLDDHPNVIKLLNYCDEQEPIMLIMEYAENGKLQSYLRSCRNVRKHSQMIYGYCGGGSSPEGVGGDLYGDVHSSSGCSSGSSSGSIEPNITSKELIKFSYHIAKGMEYIASKGIIHRDLASRNILVSADKVCKVADFGFARRVTDDCAYERTTANPVPVKWMAPEALVENKFTSKSDVFSLGILMWEIVTLGATPYEYLNSSEVYKKVTSGGRLEKPAHCKDEFYNVMSQCWLHNPADRPTFKELALQLEKLLLSENDYIELDQYPEHAYYNILNTAEKEIINKDDCR